MPLSDKLISLGNSVRNLSGTTDKLSLSNMTEIINQFSAFKNHGSLTSNDLNEVDEPGTYDVSECENKPIKNWGSLIVIKAGTRVVQIYIADSGATFIRNGYKNIFAYSWTQVGGVTKAFLYALRRHFSSSLIGGVA